MHEESFEFSAYFGMLLAIILVVAIIFVQPFPLPTLPTFKIISDGYVKSIHESYDDCCIASLGFSSSMCSGLLSSPYPFRDFFLNHS